MKRLLFLLVIALIGFYVAWPAWSGYRLATALSNKDEAGVDATVDFPSVRESLRPTVTAELSKRMDKEMEGLGALGQTLGGDVKARMLPQLVDQVLASVVTPKNVIRIAHEGGDISKAVEGVLSDAAGQIGAVTGGGGVTGIGGAAPAAGGLGGALGQILGAAGAGGAAAGGGDFGGLAGKVLGGMKKPAETASAPAAPAKTRSFGIGNIKGFGFAGPLGFDVSVARDAAQPKSDATVGMSFTGGNWKLTRVVPNL